MSKTVQHQPEHNRFVIYVAATNDAVSGQAILEYKIIDDQHIDFTRTFVPDALRSQGLAETLVRSGLRWAKEQSYEIQASCWYVAKFLK